MPKLMGGWREHDSTALFSLLSLEMPSPPFFSLQSTHTLRSELYIKGHTQKEALSFNLCKRSFQHVCVQGCVIEEAQKH